MPSWRARMNPVEHKRRWDEPQWGHDVAVVEGSPVSTTPPRRHTCRNGATTLPSWRAGPTRAGKTACAPWPQWGHDVAVVEGKMSCRQRSIMSLPQWGHDVAVVEGASRARGASKGPGRNGATTLPSWRDCYFLACHVASLAAAMGPRRCRRGGLALPLLVGVCDHQREPQWGHDVAVVEG